MKEVGLEGKEHNKIMCLRFSTGECIMGSYGEGFVGQVREFVPI